MRKIAEGLRNYDDYPLQSHAFFLQVPSLDDAGNEIGPKYVLLTHETGLEVFLIPAAIFVGVEFAKWAAKKAFDGSFSKLVEVIPDQWTQCIDPTGGWKIVRVAIRTEDKGVMELPFSKFKVSQIDCLVRAWDEIRHLSEVNQSCFGGYLCEPEPGGWGEKDLRARDA